VCSFLSFPHQVLKVEKPSVGIALCPRYIVYAVHTLFWIFASLCTAGVSLRNFFVGPGRKQEELPKVIYSPGPFDGVDLSSLDYTRPSIDES